MEIKDTNVNPKDTKIGLKKFISISNLRLTHSDKVVHNIKVILPMFRIFAYS